MYVHPGHHTITRDPHRVMRLINHTCPHHRLYGSKLHGRSAPLVIYVDKRNQMIVLWIACCYRPLYCSQCDMAIAWLPTGTVLRL